MNDSQSLRQLSKPPSQNDFEIISQLYRARPEPEDSSADDFVFGGRLPIYNARLRPTTIKRKWKPEDFYSDKSRIVFCSSFRRLMQKAQVFSLESNTSVRNRLTHSLEVADIGRTLARHMGKKLEAKKIATPEDTECMQSIVESACLLHDIGNPAFGHFGEEAIKKWFKENGLKIFARVNKQPPLHLHDSRLDDFFLFDGNPQGFRIATRLHCDIDHFGLNLTHSSLLASVKYPKFNSKFGKKLGIFSSERKRYEQICDDCTIEPGRRYFLAYVMELADDICYCLSDIADAFEKLATTDVDFREKFGKICESKGVDMKSIIPKEVKNFGYDVAIKVSRQIIDEASDRFASNIEEYVGGTAKEMSKDLKSGSILDCFKLFARRHIYTNYEVQRIEIAGSRIVEGLLNHYGRLLEIAREDFAYFVERGELRKHSGLDTEWRIYNQLSKRMLHVYRQSTEDVNDEEEWICRARLIVDYISGLTDNYAFQVYRNFMGISLGNSMP